MSGDPTLEELREVQLFFGLPSPALVEKDFHVVKALAAIAAIKMEALHLRLVFGGGTALSRAHRQAVQKLDPACLVPAATHRPTTLFNVIVYLQTCRPAAACDKGAQLAIRNDKQYVMFG